MDPLPAGAGAAVPAWCAMSSPTTASSGTEVFDQAISSLTDEIMANLRQGRDSLEALLRARCCSIVDQQLAVFREHACRREQAIAARREDKLESMRQVLSLKERELRLGRRAGSAAALSGLAGLCEARRRGDAAHLLFLLWGALAARRAPPSWEKVGGKSRPNSGASENEPPRNGHWAPPAHSPPQAPPPAHPPRERAVLRAARSDGSVTPGAPRGPSEVAVATLQPSPQMACRPGCQPTRQSSASSLPGVADAFAWACGSRAPSTAPSPPPSLRPMAGGAAWQSPGVPLPPQHLQGPQAQQPAARLTPRSSPPCRAVGSVTAPAAPGWQSPVPVASASPRAPSPRAPSPRRGVGELFTAATSPYLGAGAAPPYAFVAGTPCGAQRATSTSSLQMPQVARLRQGSPLSRSKDWSFGPPPLQAPLTHMRGASS